MTLNCPKTHLLYNQILIKLLIVDLSEREKEQKGQKAEVTDSSKDDIAKQEEDKIDSISEGGKPSTASTTVQNVQEQAELSETDISRQKDNELAAADEQLGAAEGISTKLNNEITSEIEETTTTVSDVPELNEQLQSNENEIEITKTITQEENEEDDLTKDTSGIADVLSENVNKVEENKKDETSALESIETEGLHDQVQADSNEMESREVPKEIVQPASQTMNEIETAIPSVDGHIVTEGEGVRIVEQGGEGVIVAAHDEQERTKEPEAIYPIISEDVAATKG